MKSKYKIPSGQLSLPKPKFKFQMNNQCLELGRDNSARWIFIESASRPEQAVACFLIDPEKDYQKEIYVMNKTSLPLDLDPEGGSKFYSDFGLTNQILELPIDETLWLVAHKHEEAIGFVVLGIFSANLTQELP